MGVYLDYNASTQLDQRVLDVMIEVYQNKYGNADSRTHNFGETARSTVENARKQVAELLAVNKDEVFFTSGATESDNITILGLQEYAEKTSKKHIITTSIEHKAVLEPLHQLEKRGFEVTYIDPDSSGRINADELLSKVRNDTLLVSVMHANNETGIIQPIDVIGKALSETDTFFHVDAAQSFGKLVDELKSVKYNFLSASAHKMYGPQGIGVLVLKKNRYKMPPVKSIMYGGSQEKGIRPGTIPTALIAGLGKACEIAAKEYASYFTKYQDNKKYILDALKSSSVDYCINGDLEYAMPNTLNVSFNGVNSEALMLATRQFCAVSNGSACNSTSYKPSYVLSAMGLTLDRIESAIRISWGIDNTGLNNFTNMLYSAKTMI
ncbi:MAG: aminotransferase class V-fold PLP-dependent enzyme [Ruminococcus flavefaciens]|nr:aminotransferase class V-fold PLP-dependent enzyme [Ruminococcus flavefaciens]